LVKLPKVAGLQQFQSIAVLCALASFFHLCVDAVVVALFLPLDHGAIRNGNSNHEEQLLWRKEQREGMGSAPEIDGADAVPQQSSSLPIP